ncbi:MAG: aminotransferase class I/II-fold pyridoxal phosphate-dependent enzyme [Dehalococcoidia bacterium]|nr:aminotransferase class I/II-fold pyridoxal phosphate-dependent enzyme [Dehalococcoidia bacterium]
MPHTNSQPTTAGPQAPAVRRAVILAAGKGTRLQPLTANVPKCLVEVGGVPLLERALRALASQGVAEVVIVIGYGGDVIRDRIGSDFGNVAIRYVDAPDFATTNNIRSLWDARDYLDQDILLLEADVAFDAEVITALLREPGSSAAVAPYQRPLSGTVVHHNERNQVTSFTLGAEQGPTFDLATALKTVNIYLLREALLRDELLPRLCRAVEAGHVDRYYETILQQAVAEDALTTLAAVDVSASRWYEVDDHRDLDAAEFLFQDRDAQYDRIQQLHGSYWRYGFTDHSYLYNMHFPPPEMLEVFRDDLHEVVTNYPVGQNEVARLTADWTGADPDNLAIANGAAELIKILGNQFMQRMTIPTPSFNEYEAVIPAAGLNRFPLTPGTFELDVDAFAESAIQWQSDTAIVVTPNNPTALSVSREDILRLARRLEPHNCRLIVDESFIEFARAGSAGSVEDVIEQHPNLVVIKSLSKVFGIAGLRIGYLLSADRDLIDAVRAALPIWNINGLAEEFLRTVGRYRAAFAASCDLTRSAAAQLYEDLRALPGIDPIEPDANFILARLTNPLASAPEVARRLYIEHNILIKDCAAKSMPEAARYLRIASRTPEENRVLVEALAAVLQPARPAPALTPAQLTDHSLSAPTGCQQITCT